jgi:DNA-dependent RNA polymerase auxiliary subunit epsilon
METWSRATPWRQGKFLSKATATELGLATNKPDCLVVVASHDCDLTQSSESEPCVEIVVGKEIMNSQFNGNFTNGKNARKLHLPIEGSDMPYIELEVLNKASIQKADLLGHTPSDVHLSKSGKVIFQRWLASRYRRSAFPDEFEQRLATHKLDRKIADAGKKLGSNIAAIYFDIVNEEARPNKIYLLDVVILYQTTDDAERARESAESLKDKIQKAFQAKLFNETNQTWKDIELRYVDVISDEALTYRQSQILKPWRLEYISLGADPQQPISGE